MTAIRTLGDGEIELVDSRVPLSRLDQPGGEYLVAWNDGEPVGHAYVDWRVDPPHVQDVLVVESHRRRGVAAALTSAAEEVARARGHTTLALEVSVDNVAARRLYEKLGYRPTGVERRVAGTILIRGEPLEVDDTLVVLEKPLGE